MESTIREVIYMSWPTIVIVVSIIFLMRMIFIFKSDRKRSTPLHEEIFGLFFLVYLLVLFQLVTSQDLSGGGTNLIPFREILRYDIGTSLFYRQVIGNMLLFIPLGYFATSYCKIKDLGTITIFSLLSSSIIEVTQHFIGRSFDVDDIILNVVGGILGFLLYTGLNAIKKHLPKVLQRDWVYNLLSIFILIVTALYLIKIL